MLDVAISSKMPFVLTEWERLRKGAFLRAAKATGNRAIRVTLPNSVTDSDMDFSKSPSRTIKQDALKRLRARIVNDISGNVNTAIISKKFGLITESIKGDSKMPFVVARNKNAPRAQVAGGQALLSHILKNTVLTAPKKSKVAMRRAIASASIVWTNRNSIKQAASILQYSAGTFLSGWLPLAKMCDLKSLPALLKKHRASGGHGKAKIVDKDSKVELAAQNDECPNSARKYQYQSVTYSKNLPSWWEKDVKREIDFAAIALDKYIRKLSKTRTK